MTAAQKIAMGLVITLVDSVIAGFDAVPDVLGWVLVVLGLRELRDRVATATLLPLAVLSGVVSLALLRPGWIADLPESTGWLLSLPQLVFSFVLCRELARVLARPDRLREGAGARDALADAARTLSRHLAVTSWAFLVAAAGPVLLYGGQVDVLLTPLALLSVAANLVLVYLMFRVSTVLHRPRPPRRATHPG